MSVISSSLKNLSAFLQDHQVSFSNGLLILFTIGGEQIFRFNAFNCPCNHSEAYDYALIFMLAPAAVLLLLGMAVSNLTWRVVHGCHRRSAEKKNGFCKTFGYLIMAAARAAVVPCAWLFIALLDGNYYACMLAEKPCETSSDEYKRLKAESQVISWISLGGLIAIAFIVICLVRCSDSVTFVQYKYLNAYREAEQNQWDSFIQKKATELAQTNVDIFTKDPLILNKGDWDDVSLVPDPTLPMKDMEDEGDQPEKKTAASRKGKKVFLTPLHKWVDHHTIHRIARPPIQQFQET